MEPESESESTKTSPKYVKLIAIAFVIISVVAAGKYFNVQTLLIQALDWIESLGAWGVAAFITLYIVATVLFIPGSILTLGAGTLFGVVGGFICVSIASTLGATCAFLVGRYWAREWVSQQIEGNATFKAIDEAVGQEGWKIVGLARLSPIFPFNLLNYAFGITKVSLIEYFFASWIGMIPGTILYVYIGFVLGDLAKVGTARDRTPLEWILYGAGLVATVAIVVYITKIAKKILNTKISENQ